jgi:hypothetical protein
MDENEEEKKAVKSVGAAPARNHGRGRDGEVKRRRLGRWRGVEREREHRERESERLV